MSSPIRAQLPTKWGPVDIAADFIIHVSFQVQLSFGDFLSFNRQCMLWSLQHLGHSPPYIQH